MLFEQLVDDYRRMISNNVLELYKRRRTLKNVQDENKENIIPNIKSEDKKDNTVEDPEADSLSWGWLCARMAEIYVYCPQGQNELLSLSELESKWKIISADERMGIAKNFCLMDSLCFPNNTEVRSYELAVQENRQVRFNRSGLSRKNSQLILQTENLILVLTSADERFIEKEFHSSISDLSLTDFYKGRVYNFWTRIIHIEKEEPASYSGFYKQICINLRDMSSSMTATLILFDLQINMTDLFKMGDFLGIHMPYIEEKSPGEFIFMYTDCTTLFCLPMNELIKDPNVKKFNNPKSKLNFQDETYMIDYRFQSERFYIKNMPSQGINITLFGRIDDISENCPQEFDGKLIDMYMIKLSDRTGFTYVTLWERIGQTVSNYYVGQYIVLEGLRTFKSMDDLIEVVGDVSYGSSIYNVSMATGWLATNTLRRHLHVPIKNIIQMSNSELYVDHFITHVSIAGWDIKDDKSKGIVWNLQDHTGEIRAEAVGSVSEDLLRSIGYRQMLSESLIRSTLKKPTSTILEGKWLWCCLSFLPFEKYQINAVVVQN
ncbi:5788_t:CDS:10 [Funneliformis geosporum]|uniref:5788_t:CDS:1 n=1 Tax=Funneliformis geosporum TaxID=1117311 RepID=A0A9W4SJP0_9GLOM|nr:5788_t:CDS:10 [Funneliformis geosporum]